MKKLILLIAILTQGVTLFSQDTLIYGNLLQSTYDSGAFILIDKPAYAETRYMSLGNAAPKISYLTEETSTLDKDLEFGKISDGTTERKTKVRNLVPDIYDHITISTISSTNYVPIGSSIGDRRITYSNFLTDLVAESIFTTGVAGEFGNTSFNTAVDTEIGLEVTESYITNLIIEDINKEDLYLTTNKTCELYAQKIGNTVTGILTAVATGTGDLLDGAGGSTYTLPSDFRPTASCRFRVIVSGTTFNTASIYDTGVIAIDIDYTTGFVNIAFSYVTF